MISLWNLSGREVSTKIPKGVGGHPTFLLQVFAIDLAVLNQSSKAQKLDWFNPVRSLLWVQIITFPAAI
jgi:hypothetical protein